jgi:GDP-D-mannose dehydratase
MMWMVLQRDSPGDYVVVSGVAHSVGECDESPFDQVGWISSSTS